MSSLRVAVAASAGRDSTALLHCTLRQAQPLGVQVLALHVHHGLQPQADAWLSQVREQSRRWGAGFDCRHLQGAPGPGESVEAWARNGRYRALAEMARAGDCSLVLLAHHRRDQAETWLLQALRGAGAAGLAAMPAAATRGGLVWARPWLKLPREAIDAYLRRHRLRWAEDTSNADPAFARNRLRLQVWPALQAAFPDAETTLVAAAEHAQHSAQLAAEAAAADLPAISHPSGLERQAWLALPPARRRNALRAWLATQLTDGAVPDSLVARLMAELPAAVSARWPAPGVELRLHRGQLQAAPLAPGPEPAPGRRSTAASAAPLSSGVVGRGNVKAQPIDLSRPGTYRVAGWPGAIVVAEATCAGCPPAGLSKLLAQARQGGEQFRLAPTGSARSLKKQYQSRAVPAWGREGPLLYTLEGDLIFAPGLGLDARCWAPPGTAQLQLRWVPDQALSMACTTPRSG